MSKNIYQQKFLRIFVEFFHENKEKGKNVGFKYCWTNNGNIYLRNNDNSKPIFINPKLNLDLIMLFNFLRVHLRVHIETVV